MNASLGGVDVGMKVVVRRGDKFVREEVEEIFTNTSTVVRVLRLRELRDVCS